MDQHHVIKSSTNSSRQRNLPIGNVATMPGARAPAVPRPLLGPRLLQGDRFRALEYFTRQHDLDTSKRRSSLRRLLYELIDRDGVNGSYPSQDTLAAALGWNESTVRRRTRDLERLGLVTVHRQQRLSCLYVVDYSSWLASLDRAETAETARSDRAETAVSACRTGIEQGKPNRAHAREGKENGECADCGTGIVARWERCFDCQRAHEQEAGMGREKGQRRRRVISGQEWQRTRKAERLMSEIIRLGLNDRHYRNSEEMQRAIAEAKGRAGEASS
ncbi:MAG: helix-turn-helix domain-containing protein [Gammaproteobacteria bacterium]|nr:helix-turn-helix domain-containing protein [Gammaproteobacteria bacterium]